MHRLRWSGYRCNVYAGMSDNCPCLPAGGIKAFGNSSININGDASLPATRPRITGVKTMLQHSVVSLLRIKFGINNEAFLL